MKGIVASAAGNSIGLYYRREYLHDLSSPMDTRQPYPSPRTFLCMIYTLSDPSEWFGILESKMASSIPLRLLHTLTMSGLNRTLLLLVQSVCPILSQVAPERTISSVERATYRLVELQCGQVNGAHRQPELEDGPLRLLATSCLWKRCPSLKIIGGKICRCYVTEETRLQLPEIVRRLRCDEVTTTNVALALLGNLVQLGNGAISEDITNARDRVLFHSSMACILADLVTMLSGAKLFNVTTIDEDEDDEPDDSAMEICDSNDVDWNLSSASPELVAAARGLFEQTGQSLLEGLVQGILLHTAETTEPRSQAVTTGAAAVSELLYLVLKSGSNVQQHSFLLHLSLSGEFIHRSWYSLLRGSMNLLESSNGNLDVSCVRKGLMALYMFCRVYNCFLNVAGPEEAYSEQAPLPLSELYSPNGKTPRLIDLLKHYLWQVCWLRDDSVAASKFDRSFYEDFQLVAGKLLGQLYDLNVGWKLAPTEAFHISDKLLLRVMKGVAIDSNGRSSHSSEHSRSWKILTYAPCLIPFPDRAEIFSSLVAEDRSSIWPRLREIFRNPRSSPVTINRNQLLYDGFNQLKDFGEELKLKVEIQFVDEHGLVEAGIDGGGLFKEFIEQLVGVGFDPQYGLFTSTEGNQIYPNPAAPHVQDDAMSLLEFMGRMLGKAVYEGILVEVPFAGFFLKKFHSLICTFNDLPSLDPEMYRNLMMLRSNPGSCDELGLNFTIADSSYGEIVEVELKPGGEHIPVTNHNAIEYIHRIADHRLNTQVHEVCRAFLRGFYSLIQREWVKMFNAAELQTLISGSEGGIDLADLQANVQYGGGYHENHPAVKLLWQTTEYFSPEEQQAFLRFVTGCSRPPLLGFGRLQPQMCIHMAGREGDPESLARLPTASTCLNVLKLPPYTSEEMMHSRLLYSIRSGARFDLS